MVRSCRPEIHWPLTNRQPLQTLQWVTFATNFPTHIARKTSWVCTNLALFQVKLIIMNGESSFRSMVMNVDHSCWSACFFIYWRDYDMFLSPSIISATLIFGPNHEYIGCFLNKQVKLVTDLRDCSRSKQSQELLSSKWTWV